ncbi:MAG: cardiolipin synthase [Bradymonadaceae bacterium]
MEILPGFDPATLQWGWSWWTVLAWIGRILGIAHIPYVLLQRGTRPMAALAWILCLFFLPFVGVILWWGLGPNHMKRRRRRRSRSQARISESFSSLAQTIEPTTGHYAEVDRITPAMRRARTLFLHDEHGIFPSTRHNWARVYENATIAFDAFEEAIQGAKHHVHFQFYIWRRDGTGERFRDLLVEKAKEGVEVRVLYDAVGSAQVHRRFLAPLIAAGGKAVPFLPVRLLERRLRINFRNHRKLIIIDGHLGFTGGINIADEYAEWLDLAFGFEGPVVHQLQEIFAEDWYFATQEDLAAKPYFEPISRKDLTRVSVEDEAPTTLPESSSTQLSGPAQHQVIARVVSSGPDDTLDTIQKMFFLAITSAKERVFIMTPYFVPDHAIITALQTAAMRGVDVRIILPAKSDVPITQHAGRSYVESLLEVGVQVYEYKRSVLHAKLLVFDRQYVFVGSANMDIRSFRFNFETNCVLESPTLNHQLTRHFLNQVHHSREIHLHEFQQRSKKERLLEGLARLLSPLL